MKDIFHAAISIGNTDNKLTQQEWHNFVNEVNTVLNSYAKIHFFGGSSNWEPWQNAAWIIEYHSAVDPNIIIVIGEISKRYKQDSFFILNGKGVFA